ncbi:MAG: porin family protein [Thermoanaerobaculales bacterium]|nr:porin family protein [Thermoanaerobaculales bacterium]
MNGSKTLRGSMVCLLAAVAWIAGATSAVAQDREGRWELGLATFYQLGVDVDVEGGSTLSTDDDLGFALSGGYNVTDNFATTFGVGWAGVDYDADVVQDDGTTIGVSGSYDAFSLWGNAVYYFGDGALSPYIGAGLGWTWIDTNIPNGAPSTGCWWDPWWGYVCYTTYPTKTTDAFTYQATLGLRYQFNYSTFLTVSYTSQWQDFDQAESTPRFDVIGLGIGWMF